jgi:hypothetical protein
MTYKIFVIGFNKTGTRTLCNYFKHNNIPSIHWDKGRLARRMKKNYERGKPLMHGYDKYRVFTDMEDYPRQNYAHITFFKEMEQQYPDARFILNIRDVKKWITSRNNHDHYTRDICKILKVTKEELNEKWRKEYRDHKDNVISYFSDKPNKLVVFDIEKDSIDKINSFFTDLSLNNKFYKHHGKT